VPLREDPDRDVDPDDLDWPEAVFLPCPLPVEEAEREVDLVDLRDGVLVPDFVGDMIG
jgi:hypothetical protein